MILLIITIISFLVILSSVIMGLVVIYHFNRLGLQQDPNVKKFLHIFKVGGLTIIAVTVFLFFYIIM